MAKKKQHKVLKNFQQNGIKFQIVRPLSGPAAIWGGGRGGEEEEVIYQPSNGRYQPWIQFYEWIQFNSKDPDNPRLSKVLKQYY